MIVKGADGKIYADDASGQFLRSFDKLPGVSAAEKAGAWNVEIVGEVAPGPFVVQTVNDKMKSMTADLSAASVLSDVGAAAAGVASEVKDAAAGAISGTVDGMKKALVLGGLGLALLLIITR